MKKTKIFACSIVMLIISGLLLAPSITASQVDLTPKERIETWLNNNTELGDPEKQIVLNIFIVFIGVMRVLFGEEFGMLIGLSISVVVLFPILLSIASVCGTVVSLEALFILLDEWEVDIDEVIEVIGIIGLLILSVIALPMLVVICLLLYPICICKLLWQFYDEFYEYVVEVFYE